MPDFPDWFTYQARLDRVVDGDTVDLIVDLGFRARYEARCRVSGVDTAEIYGVSHDSDEYALGLEHTRWVMEWFSDHDDDSKWPFVLDTEEDAGKYGRWPARIIAKADGAALNDDLIEAFPEVSDDA